MATDLPFEEAITFFRQKVNLPTAHWDDVYRQAHGRAFMAAGAQQAELLAGLRAAVDGAIANGTTLKQFQLQFDDLVEKTGWKHTGSANWRARIIYETNLRTAYQAGRYRQMTEPGFLAVHPYWQYRHQDSAHPRPMHQKWNGLVLRAGDPWWRTHYTPNGWGCKCRIFPLSKRGLARLGKAGPDPAPDNGTYEWTDRYGQTHTIPNGIDPGWDYAPNHELQAQSPQPAEGPELLPKGSPTTLPLPRARQVPATRLMPGGQTPESYVAEFLATLGAPDGALVKDATGGYLAVTDAMFKDGKGRWKVTKRGRERGARLWADTLTQPDEVWLQWYQEPEGGRYRLYKTFLAWFRVEEATMPIFVMMRMGQHDWEGVTAFEGEAEYMGRQRFGRLLYQRENQQ